MPVPSLRLPLACATLVVLSSVAAHNAPAGCHGRGRGYSAAYSHAAYSGSSLYSVNAPPPPPVFSRLPIHLIAPPNASLTVRLISGEKSWNRVIEAGQTYTFQEDRQWSVEFHRGGSQGVRRYAVSYGTYSFGQGDSGWELFREDFQSLQERFARKLESRDFSQAIERQVPEAPRFALTPLARP